MPIIISEAENVKLGKKMSNIPPYITKLAKKVKGEYTNKKAVGYKRIEHLLDSGYNKFKKKKSENSAKKDKKDGLEKMPTTTVKKLANDLKSPNAICDTEAQQTIKSWAERELQDRRNEVTPNKLVPKVPKLEKPPKASSVKDLKPIKVSKGDITVHEGKKTIKIKESQILSIRNQIII